MGGELAKNINQTQRKQRQVILVYKTDYNILILGKKNRFPFFLSLKFETEGRME